VLNGHLNRIVNTSKKIHKRSSVTRLSHYSIENAVKAISLLIKSTFLYQLKQSDMFSILIDITIDISVLD